MKYNWYRLASFLGWKGKNVAINTFTSFEALLIAPIMISEASREETREPATKPLSFLTLHNSVSFRVRLSRDFSRQSPKCLFAGYTVNSFDAFDGEQGWRSGESNHVSCRRRHDVGWVCCLLSPLLWKFFLQIHHRFSPSPQISIRSGTHGYV